MLQAQLKISDLAGLAVPDQPVVGVAAVVAVFDDAGIVVDGIGILQSLARAHKLRLAMRIPADKLGDGSFRDHDSGGVHGEVVVAGNDAGKAIHQNAVAVFRDNVEDDDPARADEVAGPVVVRDYDLVVARVAAGCDKRAAVAGTRQLRRARSVLLLVEPWHVVAG